MNIDDATEQQSDPRAQEALDPDASSYDIFAIYGALMQGVQIFEGTLASLALLVETDPEKVSNASLKRQLKAAIKEGVHAFQKGSPAASRNRLEGKIPDELYREIDALVPHRNRLAHSFLIQQLVDTAEGPRFRPGTALQIIEYAQRFGAVNRRLGEEMKQLAAGPPGAPAEIAPLIDQLSRAIVLDGADGNAASSAK
jgi:hypothetical protein